MSTQTIFLIQSTYTNMPATLTKLKQIASTEDTVFLMGDAVLFHNAVELKDLTNVYAMENDIENLSSSQETGLKTLNYDQFAELVINVHRCITLK